MLYGYQLENEGDNIDYEEDFPVEEAAEKPYDYHPEAEEGFLQEDEEVPSPHEDYQYDDIIPETIQQEEEYFGEQGEDIHPLPQKELYEIPPLVKEEKAKLSGTPEAPVAIDEVYVAPGIKYDEATEDAPGYHEYMPAGLVTQSLTDLVDELPPEIKDQPCETYEVEGEGDEDALKLPNDEVEFVNGKTYLQTASKLTGNNLYDHLTDVLNKILAERPENICDFFEEYSRKVKETRFKPITDHLEDIFVEPERFHLAQCIIPWLKRSQKQCSKKSLVVDHVQMSGNNTLELLHYLEHVGLGLPKPEMAYVLLSMKQLIRTQPLTAIRFWGKIFGTQSNYLILETELKEEEYTKRRNSQSRVYSDTYLYKSNKNGPVEDICYSKQLDKALQDIAKQEQEIEDAVSGEKEKIVFPPLPDVEYKELQEPPDELPGEGLNKKVFYVNNGIGQQWIQLPDITAKEIRLARSIQKYFTGNLDAEVQTYPEFPGKEKNYLRAQIARISAGTNVSPRGYYIFENVVDFRRESSLYRPAPEAEQFSKNVDFEPPTVKHLLDPEFWVHITEYILPQGRLTWWRPPSPLPELEDDDTVECECQGGTCVACIWEQLKKIVPETGPPLLSSCCMDVSSETPKVWSSRYGPKMAEEFAIILMKSNIWPGAYGLTSMDGKYYNVYLGYGTKHMKSNFNPLPLPPVQEEYPISADVLEVLDKSVKEEQWGSSIFGEDEEGNYDDDWDKVLPETEA